MNRPTDLPLNLIQDDEADLNTSGNASFNQVLDARLSRRSVLRGSAGTVAATMLGGWGLTACGGGGDDVAAAPTEQALSTLNFKAVSKNLTDVVTVPEGYTATVVYALGDPLKTGMTAYGNVGSDTDYENRAGDHHDGMELFALSATGTPSYSANDRALLAINHEATTDEALSSFFLFADGGTTSLPRPGAEIDKELAIHGISVVEVKRTSGKWGYVQGSSFNRRFTAMTECDLTGPARGDALLQTKYSPDGTVTRGTLNNCGSGRSPWGTYLSGEENWFGYFTRATGDNAARGGITAKSVVSLNRYGRTEGRTSRHGWESGGVAADDRYQRWNNAQTGAGATDDYRNEMNGMGYVVEVDAYDPTSRLKKRTALGRFAHESAAFGNVVAGEKVGVYMGCDSNNEYIYKYVSNATWDAADATAPNRLATSDKYLDDGQLYVAKFNSDGTGTWEKLALDNPLVAEYASYDFASYADICVNTRLAADAAGATKMDRPEWCGTHPTTGEIYFTLTNNTVRRVTPTGTQSAVDAANPRAYLETISATATRQGNVNGHVLRMKEGAGNAASLTFVWDIYIFGAEAASSPSLVNLSSLTSEQDFSSPDGLWFSYKTGICWIQTDDSAFTDVTNCMMLAAIPGTVGDGTMQTLNYGATSVNTYVGKKPTANTLKRFLVGPAGAEITGITETPDGKSLFINIQHPGETTKQADLGDPSKYTSHWPATEGYGAGGATTARPRSATIVITKNDGGVIGS